MNQTQLLEQNVFMIDALGMNHEQRAALLAWEPEQLHKALMTMCQAVLGVCADAEAAKLA